MIITHVVYSMISGGIETMLINIANEQVHSHKVYILILNDNIDPLLIAKLDAQVNIIYIGRPLKSKSLFYIFKLNYKLFSLHSDIIHIHFGRMVQYLFPKIFHHKLCTTYHMPVFSDNSNLKWNHCFQQIFAISQHVAKTLIAFDPTSCPIVIENGILGKQVVRKSIISKNFSKTYKLIQVGRLHPYKGQDILIKALKLLQIENLGIYIQVYFIGDGESKSSLYQLVSDCNLQLSVHFLGNQSQDYIYNNLCNYDLFVLPSLVEGFGLAIVEAMAAQMPVLVSNLPGPMDVIDQGKCGHFFECGNANDCAKKIKLIIENGCNEEMLKHAYQRVLEKYDVAITARKYLDEYGKMIEKPKLSNKDNTV